MPNGLRAARTWMRQVDARGCLWSVGFASFAFGLLAFCRAASRKVVHERVSLRSLVPVCRQERGRPEAISLLSKIRTIDAFCDRKKHG